MIALYKNTNDNNELYYALLLTDPEKLECVPYVDVGECKSLKDDITDWKRLHINSVQVEDVVALYAGLDTLKLHRGQYFV